MKNMRSHSTVHVEVYLFCNKSADLIFFDHIAVSSSNCLKVRRLWNSCANRVHLRRVQRRENKKKRKRILYAKVFLKLYGAEYIKKYERKKITMIPGKLHFLENKKWERECIK